MGIGMYREFTKADLERLLPFSYRRAASKLDRKRWNPPRPAEAIQQHGIASDDGERFVLVFESANSDWEQLVHLETDRTVEVETATYQRGTLVRFSPNKLRVPIRCRTHEKVLWIWNAWSYRDRQGSQRLESLENYAGMLVEEMPAGYRYRCNEGRDDDDYDDLVFRIERVRT